MILLSVFIVTYMLAARTRPHTAMVMDTSTPAAEDLRTPWNMIPDIVGVHGGGNDAQLFASVAQHFDVKFKRPEAVQQVRAE